MKPSFLILLLCCAITSKIFSQENRGSHHIGSDSYITANPFSLLDTYAPRLRLGYIQHIKGHWKMGLDVGYGSKGMAILNENLGESYRLWEVRPEFYYILNPKLRTLKYLAAELFYINQSNTFLNGDYQSGGSENYTYDQADFTRQKYGFHLKFGLLLNLGKKAGINFYGGIGLRWRTSAYTNIVNQQSADIFREWYTSLYEDIGKRFGPNPSLGIKFFYKL